MRFWKDPEQEWKQARQDAQNDLLKALTGPHALHILRCALEYLNTARVHDKMTFGASDTDAGMANAVRLLKTCGDTVVEDMKRK